MTPYNPFMAGLQAALTQGGGGAIGQTAQAPSTPGAPGNYSPFAQNSAGFPMPPAQQTNVQVPNLMGGLGQAQAQAMQQRGAQTPMTNGIMSQIPGLLKMLQQNPGAQYSPGTVAGNAMAAQGAANNFYGLQGATPGSFIP